MDLRWPFNHFCWKGATMQREVCGDESSECQHSEHWLCALSISYVSIMNSSHESVWLPAWDYDCSVSLINPYWLRSVWTSKDNSPWNPRPMGFEMKHWLFRILGLGFEVLKAIRFGESTLRHIQPLWNKPMIVGGIRICMTILDNLLLSYTYDLYHCGTKIFTINESKVSNRKVYSLQSHSTLERDETRVIFVPLSPR